MSSLTNEEITEIQRLPLKENYSDVIQRKREELEVRRLELELEKLQKPDTSLDYYGKMLELQEKSFNAQVEMLQQQAALRLEIEKLKLQDSGGGFAEDFLYGLLPLLPELIKQNQEKNKKGGEEMNVKKVMNMMNAKESEEYKLKIKSGVIDIETAWQDFIKAMPNMKGKITKEQFSVEYEKIKNSK